MIDPLLLEAFATIAQMESASTRAALLSCATSWAGRFGLGNVMVVGFSNPPAGEQVQRGTVLATNWPIELATRYEAERRWVRDPAIRQAVETRSPVEFTTASAANLTEPEQALVTDLAKGGLAQGIVVPVTVGGRVTATVSALGPGSQADRSAQAAIALTAPVLARRAVALAPDHGSDRSRQPAKPSARELECLFLSSTGKSSAEIAHLLELSEHTVNTHLRSAIDKLRAASRVQAVAEAIRRGWIS